MLIWYPSSLRYRSRSHCIILNDSGSQSPPSCFYFCVKFPQEFVKVFRWHCFNVYILHTSPYTPGLNKFIQCLVDPDVFVFTDKDRSFSISLRWVSGYLGTSTSLFWIASFGVVLGAFRLPSLDWREYKTSQFKEKLSVVVPNNACYFRHTKLQLARA
jgi:hypothetical protein